MERRVADLSSGRRWLKILIAMLLGLATGVLLSPQAGLLDRQTAEIANNWLALPGNLFLGLIQMIVVPLFFASVIRGLATSGDLDQLKKLLMVKMLSAIRINT